MARSLNKASIYGLSGSDFDVDLKIVQKSFVALESKERQFKQSRREFISNLYEFASKHQSDVETLNAELHARGFSIRYGSSHWLKVARLAMSKKDGGKWETAAPSQETKYATIMEGAHALGLKPNLVLDMLEKLTIERTLGQLRLVLDQSPVSHEFHQFLTQHQIEYADGSQEPTPDNKPDIFAEFDEIIKRVFPNLAGEIEVDVSALGITNDIVELVGEIDENGKMRIRAILPTNREQLEKRVEAALKPKRPLERKIFELFNDIQRFEKAGAAHAFIVNDESGVNVTVSTNSTGTANPINRLNIR